MPYLTKQFKFCAAHKYWNDKWDYDKNYKVFGEDVRIHGHNYVLDVTVTGEIDSDSGFVCDLQEIKTIVSKNVINVLDHCQIDKDIEWFKDKQPSTENLVLFIWDQISSKIKKPTRLYKIKLRETPTIFTEYFGPQVNADK